MADNTAYYNGLLAHRKAISDTYKAASNAVNDYVNANRNNPHAVAAARLQWSTYLKSLQDENTKNVGLIKQYTPAAAKAVPASVQRLQQRVDEGDIEGKQADNAEKRLKALNDQTAMMMGAGGKGIVDAAKTGTAVPNYTTKPRVDPDGNPVLDDNGNPVMDRVSSTPYSVTLQVPVKTDAEAKQAQADEKARLADRKKLDQDLAGNLLTVTGKPLSSDVIFGPNSPIRFDANGQQVTKDANGKPLNVPGWTGTKQDYDDMQQRYQQTMPPDKSTLQTTKAITMPVPDYQALVRGVNQVEGPGPQNLKDVVAQDAAANEFLNARLAPEDTSGALKPRALSATDPYRLAEESLGNNTNMQLQPGAAVPVVSRSNRLVDRPISELEQFTGGVPLNQLGVSSAEYSVLPQLGKAGTESIAPVAAAAANQFAQEAANKRARDVANYTSIAQEMGGKVTPDQVESILGPMPDQLGITGQPYTLTGIKSRLPDKYVALDDAAYENERQRLGMDPNAASFGQAGLGVGKGMLGMAELANDPVRAAQQAVALGKDYWDAARNINLQPDPNDPALNPVESNIFP